MLRSLEHLKAAAAKAAIDTYVNDNIILGIGSGSTIVHAVRLLGEKVKKENWNITCVPTSSQAKQLILENGLILSDLEGRSAVDVTIDGADEVDEQLTLIKGGGGCLTREKIIADSASKLIIIADETKLSKELGDKWQKGIPLEVVPMSHELVRTRIESELGGTVSLRMSSSGKAGPVVSDNGFYLMDWLFPNNLPKRAEDWFNISQQLNHLPGVLENGLFINMAHAVFIAKEDGTVAHLTKDS